MVLKHAAALERKCNLENQRGDRLTDPTKTTSLPKFKNSLEVFSKQESYHGGRRGLNCILPRFLFFISQIFIPLHRGRPAKKKNTTHNLNTHQAGLGCSLKFSSISGILILKSTILYGTANVLSAKLISPKRL